MVVVMEEKDQKEKENVMGAIINLFIIFICAAPFCAGVLILIAGIVYELLSSQ